MAVGVLLVTHPGIAMPLLATAERLLGRLPLAVASLDVGYDADLDALLPAASAALKRVDTGDGVLLLTDLYGASPSNLAARMAHLGVPVRRVSGLALPMLLRVMNYAEEPLDRLVDVAAAAARTGTVIDHA